jgi:DNA-binding NarL/FixJ family response regulator
MMHSNLDIITTYERLGRRLEDDRARLRLLLVNAEDALSAALAHLRQSRASVSEDLQRDLSAIRGIRAELDDRETPPTNAAVPGAGRAHALDSLTHREREVAILIARGVTNRQIADCLVISPATVRVHVEHILFKLELHTRAQLAAWMAGHEFGRPPVAGNERDKP